MLIPAQGAPHSDDGTLENVGCCITLFTLITVQRDSENEVWKTYLNETKEDDLRMADAWKQDAKGVLVFVSPKLINLRVRLNDKLQDRSFLHNCWRIYH